MGLRRACPQCRASGADFCNHDGPHGPQSPVPITPWWLRPFVKINRLDDLGDAPMCEETATSIVPNFMRARFVRKPECDGSCHHRAPQLNMAERLDRATTGAQGVLKGVGVLVLLASMGLIIHVLVIAVLVTVILALTGAVGVLALKLRSRRRRPALMPAPDPVLAAVPRTTVTSATVRPIGRTPDREMKPLNARSQHIR